MAKANSKTSGKRISAAKLYVLAIVCFALSRFFATRLSALDYGFAGLGFLLFALAVRKYFSKSRKN